MPVAPNSNVDPGFDPGRRALLTGRRPLPVRLAPTIGSGCLPMHGVSCMGCADICEAGAIRLKPTLGGPSRPAIDTDRCNGCGDCVAPCPVSAIALSHAPAAVPENAHA